MFIDQYGELYIGALQVGDREATQEEIAAYLAKADVQLKVLECKEYLKDTDHKDLPRYKAKDGEDLEAIYAKRDACREYIRANEEVK